MIRFALGRAIVLMRRGSPLPIDLTTHLLAHGIDVAALEAQHRQ